TIDSVDDPVPDAASVRTLDMDATLSLPRGAALRSMLPGREPAWKNRGLAARFPLPLHHGDPGRPWPRGGPRGRDPILHAPEGGAPRRAARRRDEEPGPGGDPRGAARPRLL